MDNNMKINEIKKKDKSLRDCCLVRRKFRCVCVCMYVCMYMCVCR